MDIQVPAIDALVDLLRQADLPVDDIRPQMLPAFRALYRDGRLLAAGGIEPHADAGLLRSLVVDPAERGRRLGERILGSLETMARQQGLTQLVLLTETAAPFFARHGYRPTGRADVPAAIRSTRQFRGLCPDSADCLAKPLAPCGMWPLQTARLRLRAPHPGDAKAIFERYSSSADVTRWLGWPRHRDLADTEAFVGFAAAEWLRWPAGPLLIEEIGTRRLLGSTGLAFDSDTKASTGFVLAPDSRGRGFAREALAAVVEAARELGVSDLYAHCHVDNAASSRLLERCGFALVETRANAVVFPNLDSTVAGSVRVYVHNPLASH